MVIYNLNHICITSYIYYFHLHLQKRVPQIARTIFFAQLIWLRCCRYVCLLALSAIVCSAVLYTERRTSRAPMTTIESVGVNESAPKLIGPMYDCAGENNIQTPQNLCNVICCYKKDVARLCLTEFAIRMQIFGEKYRYRLRWSTKYGLCRLFENCTYEKIDTICNNCTFEIFLKYFCFYHNSIFLG